MEILIPSKNIYDKSHTIIKDNIITKATANRKIIDKEKKYDVIVGNTTIDDLPIRMLENPTSNKNLVSDRRVKHFTDYIYTYYLASSYVEYTRKGIYIKGFVIPLIDKNQWVESLKLGKDDEGKPNIKCTIYGHTESGTASAVGTYQDNADAPIKELGQISYGEVTEVSPTKILEIPTTLTHISYSDNDGYASATATVDLIDEYTNLSTVTASIKDDMYSLSITLQCSLRTVSMDGKASWDYTNSPSTVAFSGQYTDYIPEQIQLTFYGNTIGINLADETITYGEGDKTFSLNGNELIQSTTTTNGVNTTNFLANSIFGKYKNGKETAELLCSISDYYKYDITKPHNRGNKHIDIETANMTFKIGDIVLPMVYNSKGIDEPLSLVGTSRGKVYEVLGTEIIYDGAVWQKLTLQEYGDVAYIPDADKLSAPIIQLSGSNKLSVIDTSRKATILEFWVNGIKTAIMPYSKSINLSLLGLKNNTQYDIYVIANAIGYLASEPSNTVTFINIKALPQPRVELDGNTLIIYDDSGDAEEFDIYAENKLLLTTMAGSSNEKGGITYNIVGKTYIVEDNEAGGKHYIIGDTV